MRFEILLVGCLTAGASAAVSVDFNAQVNADITTLTGGSGYPPSGGTVTVGGIDHQLAVTTSNRTGSMSFVNETRTVPINVFGVSEVYTLINSTVGAFGQLNGQVEVHGSGGLVQTLTLIQGDNIRDHFNGNFNNVAPNLNSSLAYPTGVRFDQQRIVLDPTFHTATLTEIRFVGQNNFGNNGNPMLQSLSLRLVPEPASLAIVAAGLAGLLRRARRPA